MGILRFFAKHGNIGKTAKWTAITYLKLKEMYPNKKDREILMAMIDLRYSVLNIKDFEKKILIENVKEMENLNDFAFSLLGAETCLSEIKDWKYIQETIEIIEEELSKYNIELDLR